MKKFFQSKVILPLKEQIRKGATPRSLALSFAFGILVGIFPVFGITTGVGIIVGFLFRLNHLALQVANYAVYAIQIIMIPIYLHYGDLLFGTEPIAFSPAILKEEFQKSPSLFLQKFGASHFHGTVLWVITGPVVIVLTYPIFLHIFKRWKFLNEDK